MMEDMPEEEMYMYHDYWFTDHGITESTRFAQRDDWTIDYFFSSKSLIRSFSLCQHFIANSATKNYARAHILLMYLNISDKNWNCTIYFVVINLVESCRTEESAISQLFVIIFPTCYFPKQSIKIWYV
jgi:hypothetical protein